MLLAATTILRRRCSSCSTFPANGFSSCYCCCCCCSRLRPSRAWEIRRLAVSQIGRWEVWKNIRTLLHVAAMSRSCTVLPRLLRPRVPCLDGEHDLSDRSSNGLIVLCEDCVAPLCPDCDGIVHATESTMLHRSSISEIDIHQGFLFGERETPLVNSAFRLSIPRITRARSVVRSTGRQSTPSTQRSGSRLALA